MSYSGLGMNYDMATAGPNAGLQALQRDLVQLGLLPAGSDSGRWDAATETATVAAAARLGYTEKGVYNWDVEKTGGTGASVTPELLALITTAALSRSDGHDVGKTNWVLWGLGGVAVVAAGTAAFFLLRKPRTAVAANRRRRNRSRR
jgi:hypothetical protein